MDKKKITAIVIAGAVLLFIIAVVLFLMMSKKTGSGREPAKKHWICRWKITVYHT